MAAVRHHTKLRGLPDPTKTFLIRAALKGWAREEIKVPDNRAPIDFITLQGMLEAFDKVTNSHFEASLFAAAFCLAFFGAFRISKLVARSKKDASGNALCSKDVQLTSHSFEIRIGKSKTDQAGRGADVVLLPLGNKRYCPVARVREYVAVRPTATGYFLIHADLVPLTQFQVDRIMIACLSWSGQAHPDKKYSSHSFRIGAATAAFKVGTSPERIKKVRRWESRYERCIRP